MMKSTRNVLKAGAASVVLGVALMSAPAMAQNSSAPAAAAPKDDAQTIVVTGSIIRNKSAATAAPVTSLSATDLADRGITTIATAVQQLSANNAGADPVSWTSLGFATGASAPSLRGFNDGYTLTLFNNMRSAYYPLADDGYRNFVDINTIPESIVDHVEVLQEGASSTYGADAIAGVVNVLIKKEVVGLHTNIETGISQHGDDGEKRFDVTWGKGKLSRDGYNFYVNFEYQHDDALAMNARGGTSNLSSICGVSNGQGTVTAGQITCENNGVRNGIQADGSYNGFQSTIAPFTRPYSTGLAALGPYQIGPQGCLGLREISTAGLTGAGGAALASSTPSVVCQQDNIAQYLNYNPDIKRMGANARFTKDFGNAEAYVMVNYYETKTRSSYYPLSYTNQTAAGSTITGVNNQVTLNRIFLPVYVCSEGVGSLNGTDNVSTGCNASNGTLNPNNPYASQGNLARLVGQYDRPTETLTDATTLRFSGGIHGSFGPSINYDLEGTYSSVTLDVTQLNDINLQNLLTAVAQGTYNFLDPAANSEAQRDFIAPPSYDHSISKLSEIQLTLSKDLFQLPGGALTVAVGGDHRYEAIHNPSANPVNLTNPLDRYYNINSVGVDGARNVWGAFYEVSAPIARVLHLKAEGRYDSYSTGQSAFSPKFEAEFSPISEIKLRGTYTKGFKAPSFNQAYGLPTTGYITTQINCQTYAAFCASHGGVNSQYLAGTYSYGLTSVGTSTLAPEKSDSYTLGIVLTPTPKFQVTVDYWHTKIKDIIVGPVPSQAILDAYYLNNGVVNIPGIAVTPGVADAANPNALPLLGNITAPFINALSEVGDGIDVTFSARIPLNHNGLRWTSNFNASYLNKLAQTEIDGSVQVYQGSLSPCNITSCSGAPKWRGSWENKLDFNGRGSVTLTAYYTSGYDLASTDYGGIIGNCTASIGASVVTYADGSTPVKCTTNATFDMDLGGSLKVGDHFTIYGNITNLLNNKPPFDPSAGYSYYQFNPAWGDANFIGRYFKIGAKLDF